jgi:hypothetical protein
LLALTLCWSGGSFAAAVPVLYVAVNGSPEVSFENDQVCDGTKAVLCLGTGATGDLLISSFELTADPDPYVTGAFNFYNASTTDTLSVVATVLFPMSGTFITPDTAIGTGLVNNVFGGGVFNLVVEALVDPPGSPFASISEVSPGVPFTVCEDPGFDPACQGVTSLSASGPGATLTVLAAIGLRISFDITPDTTATIGLDPSEPFDGAAYFSITPAIVPVPAAVWLFGSALGLLGWTRRRSG